MKQVLYSKYNRTRKPEFQIGTKIYTEDDNMYVEKFALSKAAISHIENIERWSQVFEEVYTNIRFQHMERTSEDSVVYKYLDGIKLLDVLMESMESKDAFVQTVAYYLDKMFVFDEAFKETFVKTTEFTEVFGDVDGLEGLEATTIANIDMIFDNVFLCGDEMYLIDNEWGADFLIPIDFIKYRTLHYLYTGHASDLKNWMSEKEFCCTFGIEEKYIETFAAMEESFQIYTSGGRYTDQYLQRNISFGELMEKNAEAERARVMIPELQHEVEERNAHIKNLDNHIIELDGALSHTRGELVEVQRDLINTQRELINIKGELERTEESLESTKNELMKSQEQVDLCQSEIVFINKDVRAKQEYIEHLERISEAYRVELDQIRYYKKHPIRRLYRIMRRIGGKVWRKVKPVIRKVITPAVYTKKITIPKFNNPKVSIVIPVYNEFAYTYECIKSIIENVKDVSYEIIVGDDMSTDTTKKIKKIIKNVKVNINETDHGFLMNCNRAAKLAKGEYIVFLNNDTLVKENWLESLVTLIESDEKIGLVGSKLVYPDGRMQEAGGIIWKDASGWNYGREKDPNMPEYNYVRECDYLSGASIMISKSLWEEIGGFDERFKPAYCEDSDLAFEVRKHGYKVMFQPQSVVVHFEGVSNGTDVNGSGLKKYQVENNAKFREKWAKELEQHYENGQVPFCARERNYDKKVILFIDHYVPTYDKDAGSKTTFQYIKMFLAKGYIVKFIGDNYAQMEPYTTTLQQMGVEVLYGPWYAQHIFEWIDANKDNIDFAYLNRPHISVKYIDFLREKTNIKLIYYGHDLHFLRTEREAELTGNQELLVESKAWKKKEFDLMRKVSMAYYPSPVEEQAIHAIDETIPVKAITAYVFDKFIENYTYDADKRSGILFVGGFSHGPNVDAIKWFTEEIYPRVREKKDIPFIIVGSNAPDEIKALDGKDGIIVKGFVSDEELAELYATSKMVVVPLRYGAGVKGKVVEAIHNGLPIVTTSVGAEGIDGVESVLSIEDDPVAFADSIVTLYDDKEKLAEMGNKTQEFIKEKFSVEAVWNIVKDDFQ